MQSPSFDTAAADATWQIDFGRILIDIIIINDNNNSKSSRQSKPQSIAIFDH